MNQALHDLIINEDVNWVSSVSECTHVPTLLNKPSKTRKASRRAIIQARIDNLNYLVS